ncbi:hypothetical protein AVEN_202909-1 [Araneus ventricosus]|uniref:Uncharacterized protein n=1 Tax=Araneus ventricosus TaxID=182803 RepID=A0A4Y2Q878_ARAVE|nr:hypothetical protein AVEN_202909-1 [Araneus ventricosus]
MKRQPILQTYLSHHREDLWLSTSDFRVSSLFACPLLYQMFRTRNLQTRRRDFTNSPPWSVLDRRACRLKLCSYPSFFFNSVEVYEYFKINFAIWDEFP